MDEAPHDCPGTDFGERQVSLSWQCRKRERKNMPYRSSGDLNYAVMPKVRSMNRIWAYSEEGGVF